MITHKDIHVVLESFVKETTQKNNAVKTEDNFMLESNLLEYGSETYDFAGNIKVADEAAYMDFIIENNH
jgi:hypothetical protein